MIRTLQLWRECPVYGREIRLRSCRDRAVLITVWVLVAGYYGVLLGLVAGALYQDKVIKAAAAFGVCFTLLVDPVCRLLGVLIAADAFSGERAQRTLDALVLSPISRRTLAGAKLLARLNAFRAPLIALIPGLAVLPPCVAWLTAPELPARADGTVTELGAFAGLSLTFYCVALYPVIGSACSFLLGNVVGAFYSLAIRSHGLAVGLAFGTVLVLSIAFCFLSYFALGLGSMLGGLGTATLHPTIGAPAALAIMVEEVLSRGVPALLLAMWLVQDFDRLAAE